MIAALSWAVGLALALAAIVALTAVARSRSRKADPGAVLFERAVELMGERPGDWNPIPWNYGQPRGYELPGARLMVIAKSDSPTLYGVAVAGKEIWARYGWRKRLGAAYFRMEADRAKAAHLTAICDAIEKLGESNVIPLRRAAGK